MMDAYDANADSRGVKRNIAEDQGQRANEDEKGTARTDVGAGDAKRRRVGDALDDRSERDLLEAISEDKGRRRSTRERVSRYVEIDGYKVLKLNNYSLESGELSVFRAEAQGQQASCSFRNARTPYQIFMADVSSGKLHAPPSADDPEQSLMQRVAALWRSPAFAPGSEGRADYQRRAEEEKREIFEERRREEERANLAAARERARVVEEERRKLAKARERERKKEEARKNRPVQERRPPTEAEIARRSHNASMKTRYEDKVTRRRAFFSVHRRLIESFVEKKTLQKLPIVAENDVAKYAVMDALGAPAVTQPATVVSGEMRPYQLKGLEWLLHMFDTGLNPILGDEMGLGKTLQTISFLAALKERGLTGPSLIVVPLSVLSSWLGEFRRWCPSMRVVRIHSTDRNERERLRKEVLNDIRKYDVCLTTYEYLLVPEMKRALSSRVIWRVVVLDEGHKVKNEKSLVSQAARKIRSECVLLLTGTPLQNNLVELWALLNYLYPTIFTEGSRDKFTDAFELNAAGSGGAVKIDRSTLDRAHYLLRPLMLRRLKNEVEKMLPPRLETKINCPLSEMQQFWYKRMLLKDSKLLERLESKTRSDRDTTVDAVGQDSGNDWAKLQSLMMQLRKVCNHPFLFPNAEAAVEASFASRGAEWRGECSESIVWASGKMQMLDRLLRRLKEKGHRVVIFSQFTQMLDIVDDYLVMRGYAHARLDGSTNRVQRYVDIHEFNKADSPYFCFIMSTRAGGMGINLQTADTVILMDSDWNPQVDLQAMARVHRIGQTKIVHVYRLVSAGTMEERIVQRAQKKLFLDAMVNRGSTATGKAMDRMDTKAMLQTITFGMDRVFDKASSNSEMLTDDDIDRIVDRTRKDNTDVEKAEKRSLKSAKNTAATFDERSALVALRNFQGKVFGGKAEADAVSSDGKKRRKKQKGTYRGIAEAWAEELAESNATRQRRSRFITIDGHTVLKQNVYTMKEGEPSVFKSGETGAESKQQKTNEKGSSAGGRAASALGAVLAATTGRQIAGRDYDHQDFCMACLDGGDLILCDYCPAAYHATCVGVVGSQLRRLGRWSCPHHSCIKCSRKSNAVGGLLFRCEMCPVALCEDHLTTEAQSRITNKCPRFIALGQRHPSQACFMLCSEQCARRHRVSQGGVDIRAIFRNEAKAEETSDATASKEVSKARTPSPEAAYRKSDWDRLKIATQTHPLAIQRRLDVVLQSGCSSIDLRRVPGLLSRWKETAKSSRDAIFKLLSVAGGGSDAKTVDDVVLGWSGFGSGKDSRIANTSRRGGRKKKKVKKETLDEKRERAAGLYLRLIRVLQMQGASRVFQSYQVRDLVYLLGLRTDKPIVSNRHSSMGVSSLAELAAVFLTFPGGVVLQTMDKSFFLEGDHTGWTSSEEEEEEDESEEEENNDSVTAEETDAAIKSSDSDIMDLLNSTESIEELVTRIECDSKIDNDNVEFDEERAFAWLQRSIFGRAKELYENSALSSKKKKKKTKNKWILTGPAVAKVLSASPLTHQIMSDVVGSVPLFRTSEEFEKSLKVWVLRSKLDAVLKKKVGKKKSGSKSSSLPKGWTLVEKSAQADSKATSKAKKRGGSSFRSPLGRSYRSKAAAENAAFQLSHPIVMPLLAGEIAVATIFARESARMTDIEDMSLPLLEELRTSLIDPEQVVAKFQCVTDAGRNGGHVSPVPTKSKKNVTQKQMKRRCNIPRLTRKEMMLRAARFERCLFEPVKVPPKLPPEVPSDKALKNRFVSPVLQAIREVVNGQQGRYKRSANIELLEQAMIRCGWVVKQSYRMGGMVNYVPPMPAPEFSSSEEEEESSEEESSDDDDEEEEEEEEEEDDDEESSGDEEDEEEDEVEEAEEEEKTKPPPIPQLPPRLRSIDQTYNWIETHTDDLVTAARHEEKRKRKEKIARLPEFVWGRRKVSPKKTQERRLEEHMDMLKKKYFDVYQKRLAQHHEIMSSVATEASHLLHSVVMLSSNGFEVTLPSSVRKAAIFFAAVGPSVVSSEEDVERLNEVTAMIDRNSNANESSASRAYNIGEAVEVNWNGKFEWYNAVIDSIKYKDEDDETIVSYAVAYDDGSIQRDVPASWIRRSCDAQVTVKTESGSMAFTGRRALRSAFALMELGIRVREDLLKYETQHTGRSADAYNSRRRR